MSATRRGEESGRRVGDYELLNLLGRGGMAEVWLARRRGPEQFERKVVIKRILPEYVGDASFVKMFVAEARLSARLNHPNIVGVHELGERDGLYYIVMEYVRGPDLRSVLLKLQDGRPIEPGLGAFVVRDLARALGYAHDVTDDDGRRLRLIHRDVSPSNVVISFDGNVKLVDFGIAKALEEVQDEHTRTGSLKGKIGYMAPEQLGAPGTLVDHRSDLWAAGVVLWETLTGKRLFRGGNEVHTLDLVRAGPIANPSEHNPAISPELDRIARKALSRDLAQRYQTGDEMAQDLDRVLAELRFGPAQMTQIIRNYFESERDAYSGRVPKIDSEEELRNLDRWVSDGPTPAIGATTKAETVNVRPPAVDKPPGSRKLLFASIGGVLFTGAAAVTFLTRPAAEVTVAPVAPAAPAKRTSAKLHVDSTPRGALIFVGTEAAPRGETPLDLLLQLGTGRSVLRAEQTGYISGRQEFVPDHDDVVYFQLAPDTPKPPAGKTPTAKTPTKPKK